MRKFIEKLKPSLMIIGTILGILALWIVFQFITNGYSVNYGLQKNSATQPMTSLNRMNLSKDSINTTEVIKEKRANYDSDITTSQTTELSTSKKKVIKNGNLNLKVEKTEKATETISVIVKNQTGEIFSTNFYERIKGQKSGTLTARVPVEKFEETLAQIKKIATQVVSESTTGQDVTEKYSDLQVQIKNKRAEEQSFIKILDRANKIEDVLAITKQISRVRGEIERLEGQIKFMDSQTNMSTIIISLSEDVTIAPIQNNWRPWQVAKKSFNDLLNNIQDFADSIIRFIIVGIPSLIPFLFFLGIIYWIGKKVWHKIKN